jgi:phosphotransacetylase
MYITTHASQPKMTGETIKSRENRKESPLRISNFRELAQKTGRSSAKSRLAVVEANDPHTRESVVAAHREGIAEAVLIGKEARIKTCLEELGEDFRDYEILCSEDAGESLGAAIRLIHKGGADVLMKGQIETGEFMRAILNRENGLRKGQLLSVVGLFELERYHKILAVSDQAINTYPDLAGKKAILENAVGLLHALGIERPKTAVLAAVEKVNPKMKETVDADALKTMNRNGEIAGCIVDGPLSFDIATSGAAASVKGYESEVAGDADLLIVPDIVCGNVLVKALSGFAGATTAGAVVGAKVPIVLTPRSSEPSDKFYSIALAAYAAQNYGENLS